MVELAKNPQYWRKCTEWARRIANAIHDEQARRLMLSVAKDYERAAELTEKQLRALSNRNCRSGGGYSPTGEDHCFVTAQFPLDEPRRPI
jgi:hypothetical protein